MDPNDLDLSATTTELFPELAQPSQQHQGARLDSAAEDHQAVQEFASQQPVSAQELNFKALRDEIAKAKQEREYWRGKAEQTRLDTPPEPQKHDPLSDIDSDDWAKGGAVKEAVMDLREENKKLRAEMADQLAAMQIKSQYSDWKDMVTKHVPELTSTNPIFAEMIDRSSNPYEAAYLLARLNAGGQQPQQQQFNPNAQRALSNSQKPASPSTVGGQATLNAADHYASMSDDDFMKMAMKNMAGI